MLAPKYGLLDQRGETTGLDSFIQRSLLGDLRRKTIKAIKDGMDHQSLVLHLVLELGDRFGLLVGFKGKRSKTLAEYTL
jgi:hypothetical protein